MSPFKSVFAEHLTGYVTLRRRLGCVFSVQERTLCRFDRFVHAQRYQGLLTDDLVRAFAVATPDTSSRAAAYTRYMTVRAFAEYVATFEPRTPQLDPKAFTYRKWRRPPYVFTDEELDRLLQAASRYSRHHRVLCLAVHAMVGIAASSGLRLREVVGLDVSDIDLDQGVLMVRRSKFDKDRLVPVHATTRDVLRGYAAIRGDISHAPTEVAFFLSTRGQRFKRANVEKIFRGLVGHIDLHPAAGAAPTFYSLRHTFAVRRLITWHQAGAHVQALLPALATYMGHVDYTSTAYYLTATAELLAAAGQRLVGASQGGHHGQDT
jgi:integrase